MKFLFDNENNNSVNIENNGEILEVNVGKIKRRTNDINKAFEPINEYLSSLPDSVHVKLMDIYKRAALIKNEIADASDYIQKLSVICKEIYDLLDWDHLRRWVLEYGRFTYDAMIKEACPIEYDSDTTYIRSEYDELVIVSYYFKLIYHILADLDVVGKCEDIGHIELRVLDILEPSGVLETPAMQKLTRYFEKWIAKDESKLTSPIITRALGIDVLPKYLLGISILSRICVEETRKPNETMVKYIYNKYVSTIRELTAGVQDKQGKNSADDDIDPLVDTYRINQELPDYAVVIEECDAMNFEFNVKHLNPNGDVKKAENYYKLMLNNPLFTIARFHSFFIGLTCYDLMSVECLPRYHREPFLALIGVTAGFISDLGHQDLANLIISPRVPIRGDSINMGTVVGMDIAELTSESKEILKNIYPYLQGKSTISYELNPGLRTITNVIEEINSYEWNEDLVPPRNIKNEIVALLNIREEKLCIAN